jgi:hypothetical protein
MTKKEMGTKRQVRTTRPPSLPGLTSTVAAGLSGPHGWSPRQRRGDADTLAPTLTVI